MPRDDRLPAALLGALVPAGLAFANGGYFPREWGIASLLLLLAAGTALLLRDSVSLTPLDVAPAAALALLGLWQLVSVTWSPGPTEPVLEAERTLVYLALALAVPLVVSRASASWLAGGVVAGIMAVALWGVVTRLWPDLVAPFESGRLAEPIGYSNAVGTLAVLGLLLSTAFAAARDVRVRCAAAAASPVLAAAFALTFSRGAWLALAGGSVALVALLPERVRRLPLLLPSVLGAGGAVLVILSNDTLASPEAAMAAVRAEAPEVTLLLVLLAAGSAVAAAALARAEARLTPSPAAVRRARIVAVTAAVVGMGVVLVQLGNPIDAVSRGYDAFTAPPPEPGKDLGGRLASASGNGRADFWRVALRELEAHPLLGGGAGSYERWWFELRPTPFAARDAHNLYLEVLAELGPIGLALVLVVLGVPLVALRSFGRSPLAAAAGAAYVAFLLHAGLDWDWEIPAVTATAITIGFVLVIGARVAPARVLGGRRAVALVALAPLAAAAALAHAGNGAAASAESALDRSDPAEALAAARRAVRFAPWSTDALRLRAEARALAGDEAAGLRDLRETIERDRRNWRLWYALALATQGEERRRAAERVVELNPRVQDLAPLDR